MSTATLNQARDVVIFESVDRFLSVHEEWINSPETHITEKFEDSLDEAIETCRYGDVPKQCRGTVLATEALSLEWERFKIEATDRNSVPDNKFWRAVDAVRASREKAVQRNRPPIESVQALLAQKVSPRQIAEHIYGYRGKGPFLLNGAVREDLIEKEAKTPGSVIGKDWVHPQHAEEEAKEAELVTKRAERSFAKRKSAATASECPESIEELLTQKVSVKQIVAMKGCSVGDVLSEANRLGIKPKMVENVADDSPLLAAPAEGRSIIADGEIPVMGSAIGDDSIDSIPLDGDELKSQIYTLADQGFPAKDIATQLDVDGRKVAAVLRHRPAGSQGNEGSQGEEI